MATILVVDDRPINREFLVTLLRFSGHRMIEAEDGADALLRTRESHPDLIITDILMPTMDGVEFVRQLHTDPEVAEIPVIFYTATYRSNETSVLAESCGVSLVLPKPSEPQLILDTVHQVLGLKATALGPAATVVHLEPKSPVIGKATDRLSAHLKELEELNLRTVHAMERGLRLVGSERSRRVTSGEITRSMTTMQGVSLRLAALVELGQALSSHYDPLYLLDASCRAAQDILSARYAAVGVLDENRTELRHLFLRGMPEDAKALLGGMDPQAGLLGRALMQGRPQRAHGLDDDPEIVGLPASHPAIDNFLVVPIILPRGPFGWLYVADKLGADEFDVDDERFAVTLAAQLAAAQENYSLYDEIRRHNVALQKEVEDRRQAEHRLAAQYAITRVLAESATLAEAIPRILETLCVTLMWEVGEFWTLDGAQNVLRWVSTWQDAGAPGEAFVAASREVLLDSGWGLVGEIFSSGEPLWVPDIQLSEGFSRRAQAAALGLNSAFGFPVRMRDERLGMIVLFRKDPNDPGEELRRMLGATGSQIGAFIERKRAEQAVEQLRRQREIDEQRLHSILQSIDNVVWAVSVPDLEFVYMSPVAQRMYGYSAAAFYEQKNLWRDLVLPEDRPSIDIGLAQLYKDGAYTFGYRIRRADNEVRWLEVRASVAQDDAGNTIRIDGVTSDVTERRDYESRVHYLATHDGLTDLPNRNLLHDRVVQSLAHVRRTGRCLALLFLDLDRFKFLNDSFGHTFGDGVLKAVGKRLAEAVTEGDTVARLGGDEFVVLVSDLPRAQDAATVVQKVLDAFSLRPLQVGERELHVTASIGVSVFPDDGDEADTLLKHADAAMYRAKEQGRNNAQFYTREMGVHAQERVDLEGALRIAIQEQQFELHYQPQVDLRSGVIRGVEALIRWHHPVLGMVPPAHFIGLAEDTGLISPIGEWALRAACRQLKLWHNAGYPELCVAVNISARQFRQRNLPELVRSALEDAQLQPERLEIELTESTVMHDTETVIHMLRRLKAIGVSLSMDDFGTGYSSLSYIKRFPIDAVKIDQSFIRELTSNIDDAAITKAIIAMAQSIGMRTVAEGVETEGQAAMLIASGCDEMQGYFFSRPLPVAELEAVLLEGRRLPEELLRKQQRQRTLLLVDDEENILAALKRLLRRDGYRILTATNGEQGLEMLAQHKVDVILSDQRMPGMTGVEFLSRTKSMYPDTIRIVLSGYTELSSITDSVNEGAVYKFLTKPWDDQTLRDNIDEAFRRKHSADEHRRLSDEVKGANVALAQVNAQLQELLTEKQEQIVRDETSLDIVREALQHIPAGVIGMDDAGMIAFVNLEAAALFANADLLGADVAHALHPTLHRICVGCDGLPHAVEVMGRSFRAICRPMGERSASRGKLLMLVAG